MSRYNHISLPSLDYPGIVAQMTELEAAFLRTVGFFPAYMRTPYLFFNDVVLRAMADLGYHVIGASIDTKDYENDDPGRSWVSFEKFRAELNAGGNIVLAHDTHQTTVQVLVENMLEEIEARGMTRMCCHRDGIFSIQFHANVFLSAAVTVGQCLGDPPEFWYRAGR